MPWTGQSFAHHNGGLTPAQSTHAAHIANAILRRTGDEGMAIAVANRDMRPHRDAGGMTPAAPAPTPGLQPNNSTQSPVAQSYESRFAQMSPEQLQELLPRLAGSPLASIAQAVLQQKRVTPQQAAPAQQAKGGMVAPPIFHARVGMAPHRAAGGPAPYSNAMTPGQYTALPGVPGAYVGIVPNTQGPPPPAASMTPPPAGWPASTANGGPSLQSLFPQGGIKPAPAPAAATAPAAVMPAVGDWASGGGGPAARGGGKGDGGLVPILAAGGEFVISPEHVARLGEGDVKLGHRRLDEWVVRKRAEIVKEMKKLKPPVRS